MKKKFLIICMSIFLLTGCTTTYEMKIEGDQVTEKITINNNELTSQTKEIYSTNAMPVDYRKTCYLDYDKVVGPNTVKEEKGTNYYDVEATVDGLFATSVMEIKDYQYARALNMGFTSMHVNNYEHYISIYGYDGPAIFNSYADLESFKVIITTDKFVSDNNADLIDGTSYIWNFTPEDVDKTLYIEMDSTQVTSEKQKKINERNSNMAALAVLGITILVLFVFGIYVSIRRKRANKI